MDNLVFGILLAYAFLLGLKLIRPNAAGAGDLRAAGAILAFAMVPAVALERFRPGALGSVKLFEADLDVLAALTALFGTLLAIELLLGFGSFVRVRSKGEDYLRIHRALFRIGLLLIVFPIVLKVRFGDALDFTRVLQSAAVGSIILGLALQNTLSNLFAGLGIEAENMLRQGDFVKIGLDGPRGIVIDKTWRSTRILTNDGETVFVPNNEIGNILLINYDRPTRVVALRAEVGVAYDAPPLVVKETIEQAIRTTPEVLEDPPIQVWTRSFDDSSIKYVARYWVGTMRGHEAVRDSVNTSIWYAFRDQGVEIPFPIRTLHMVDKEEIEKSRSERQGRRNEVADFLAGVEPFKSHGSHEDRLFLGRNAREERHAAGSVIVRKGDRSDAMYVIRDGTCEVVLSETKRVELKARDFFGEIGLLGGRRRTADVVASQAGATVLRLGRDSIRMLLARRASLRAELDKTGDLRLEELRSHGPEAAETSRAPLGAVGIVAAALRLLRPW